MTTDKEYLQEYEQLELDLGIPEVKPIAVTDFVVMKEQLIADIVQLGIKAHRVTKNCIFVEFCGHVNKLHVSIRESTEVFKNELLRMEIYTDTYRKYMSPREIQEFETDTIKRLKQTKDVLESIIECGGIAARQHVAELLHAN